MKHAPLDLRKPIALQRLQGMSVQAPAEAALSQAVIQRAMTAPDTLTPADVLALQPVVGNATVQRIMASRTPGAPSAPVVQAKLMVGPVGDRYEQEADRVARQVVSRLHLPKSSASMPDGKPQKSALGTSSAADVRREAGSPNAADPMLQGGAVTPELEHNIQRARGSGLPLAHPVRTAMEQAFGADFSGVRVHHSQQGDALNRSISARAFTTGQDIFFRQGEFNPGSREGQGLLAHELTHVVQQNPGSLSRAKKPVQRQLDGESVPEISHITSVAQRTPVVQRLVATEQALYVPQRWAAQTVKWEGGDKTVGAILKNHKDKSKFVGYVGQALDLPLLADIKDTNGTDVFAEIQDLLPQKRQVNRTARQKINTAFQAHRRLLRLDSERISDTGALQEEMILRVQDMLPEASDLETDPNPTFVCALIALVRNEGQEKIGTFLKSKEKTEPREKSTQAYAYALHHYYFEKGTEYDDLASHMLLFRDWGYRMVFSGTRGFRDLWQVGLKTGKHYIVDVKAEITEMGEGKQIKGHTMAMTMKKNFDHALAQEELLAEYFTLHNESWNWNYSDIVNFNADVFYVFEK